MLCSHQPDSISPVASELTSHWSLYVATGKKNTVQGKARPKRREPKSCEVLEELCLRHNMVWGHKVASC